jgi:hypothetical protein
MHPYFPTGSVAEAQKRGTVFARLALSVAVESVSPGWHEYLSMTLSLKCDFPSKVFAISLPYFFGGRQPF